MLLTLRALSFWKTSKMIWLLFEGWIHKQLFCGEPGKLKFTRCRPKKRLNGDIWTAIKSHRIDPKAIETLAFDIVEWRTIVWNGVKVSEKARITYIKVERIKKEFYRRGKSHWLFDCAVWQTMSFYWLAPITLEDIRKTNFHQLFYL